jgi:hypothetical protein
MGKEVKNRVSLDASRFTRGTRQVRRDIKQLERGLTIDMKKAARIGARGLMAVGAAGTAAAAGLAVGINKAIQLGARLDHMADATGMAAGELRVLEQAFEDNGVAGDQVGKTVNKLQKSITEASQGLMTYQRAFDTLGLSTENLLKMTPEQQFAVVADAISNVDNQAVKAATAMQIFGRQGAQLMGVFENGAIDSARESLGKQTEILNRRAKDFEEAATLLDRAGNKMSGFFVGISDRIIDTILPLLNRMDSMDFAEQGQRFGDGLERGIRAVVGVFQQGTFGDIVRHSLILSGKSFINTIARGWAGLVKGITLGLLQTGKGLVKIIAEGFKDAIAGLKIAVLDMDASLKENALGEDNAFATLARSRANLAQTNENIRQKNRGAMPNADQRELAIAEAFTKGMADLADFNLIDVSGNEQAIANLIKSAIGSVQPQGQRLVPSITPEQLAVLRGEGEESDGPGNTNRQTFGAASSLASIGGGGGVAMSGTEALVDQTKEQTGILRQSLKVMEQIKEGFGNKTFQGPQYSILK